MTSPLEIRSKAGDILAILVTGEFSEEGVNFLTQESSPLQLAVINHRKGVVVEPHYHRRREIKVDTVQEVIHIKEGRVRTNIYDSGGRKVRTLTLEAGDTIILAAGGHGFEVLQDTRMIEVKQGPYSGKEFDKEPIGADR